MVQKVPEDKQTMKMAAHRLHHDDELDSVLLALDAAATGQGAASPSEHTYTHSFMNMMRSPRCRSRRPKLPLAPRVARFFFTGPQRTVPPCGIGDVSAMDCRRQARRRWMGLEEEA